jgi:hypothetical protein
MKELSVSMNSTILHRRTAQANSDKKWKVNYWHFAGLRRELSPTAIGNMNRVVAMHWINRSIAYGGSLGLGQLTTSCGC